MAGCRTKDLIDTKMSDLALRELKPENRELLFSWRNDPWIVALSTSQKTISVGEHRTWFKNVLINKNILIRLIVGSVGLPMGLVSLMKEGACATISIYLMQPFVGYGRGSRVIAISSSMAFDRWPDLMQIDACIRVSNYKSVSAFSKMGYVKSSVKGDPNKPSSMVVMSLRNHRLVI